MADNHFDRPGDVAGVIGVELFVLILGEGSISEIAGSSVAVETIFGYFIIGKNPILD